MSRKTTDQKTEKQTAAKKPVVLKDDELDSAAGGFDVFVERSLQVGGGSQVTLATDTNLESAELIDNVHKFPKPTSGGNV